MKTTTKNTLGLSLKRFAHYARMSEETTAFNADLVLNGIVVGTAQNDGHGGCTNIHLNEQGRKNPVLVAADALGEFEDGSLNSAVDALVDAALFDKETARLKKKVAKDLATMVLFNRKGDKDGSFRTFKANGKTPEEVIAFAKKVAEQPDVTRVLNLMPFDEAFNLLVKIG